MTLIEEHKKRIKEHLEEIEDAIDMGIEKKPITIGFHSSACASELLELYLHTLNKISIGKIIKHDWFKKPQPEQKIKPLIERKLPVEFNNKKELYDLIYEIEENRNNLIYGKATKEQIKRVLDSFLKFKELVNKLIKQEVQKNEYNEN